MIMAVNNPIDEVYDDVRDMIHRAAWDAARKHGGDVDDYVSAGNEAFMEAWLTWDPDRGTAFSTWCWWKIRGAITSETKRRRPEQLGTDMPQPSRFDARRFLLEAGRDAGTVARMLWETPWELDDILHHKDTASCVRGGIQRRLKSMGWTWARIMESFDEIREALK